MDTVSISTISWSWKKPVPHHDTERVWSSLDVIFFNRCPHSPWLKLLVSQIRRRTCEMAPFDTPLIPDLSLRGSRRPEKQRIFSIIVGGILLATLFWDSNLHIVTAHSWIWWSQMQHIAFEAIGIISTLEKQDWPGQETVMVYHRELQVGRKRSFYIS